MAHIVYNTTYKVDTDKASGWLEYMRTVFVPKVLASKCFVEWKMMRIAGDENEDGITYALQLLAADMKSLVYYHAQFDADIQRNLKREFEGRFADFVTILEVIDEG